MSRTVIVVGHTEIDEYGNMLVTDKGGGVTKIAKKREHLHSLFEQGKAVELDWQTYMNRDYVSDARLVEDALPGAVEPPVDMTPPKSAPARSEVAPQERGLWWKEIGRLIVADKLEEVFGEKDTPFIRKAYKLQAIASLGITAKKES